MGLGKIVRGMFGGYERQVSDIWRGFFIDLDEFVSRVVSDNPSQKKSLKWDVVKGLVQSFLHQMARFYISVRCDNPHLYIGHAIRRTAGGGVIEILHNQS